MTSGVVHTDTVLDRILRQTAIELESRKAALPESELERQVSGMTRAPLSLASAIDREYVAVIAEVKRGSPSRGVFPVEIAPETIAAAYSAGGAAAISCLTDGPFFHGTLEDLKQVAAIAHRAEPGVPVLRKDFIVDRYQLLEARLWGADVVLLIVAALDDSLLALLNSQARDLGLSVLVEVHNEIELERAMRLSPEVIGVNNRNLHTFEVDLGTTERLAGLVPADTLLVSESGIFSPEHVRRVGDVGAAAVLVGESLILQENRETAVRALAGEPRSRSR